MTISNEFKKQIEATKGARLNNNKLKFEAKWRKSSADKYQRRYMSYEPTAANLLKGIEWREDTLQALMSGADVGTGGVASGVWTMLEAFNQADNDKWSKNDSNWRTIANHHGYESVKFFGRERKIDSISYSDVVKYRDDLDNRREGREKDGQRAKLAHDTINKYMRCLETIFKTARKHGKYSLDAAKAIPEIPFYPVNKQANSKRCFEFDQDPDTGEVIRDEEKAFYEWCDYLGDHYLELKKLVKLGIYTGIRIGAILALEVKHVNFRKGTITITKQIDKADNARVLTINPVVKNILKYFINNRVGSQKLIVSRIDAILEREKKVGSFQWNNSKIDRYFKKIKTRMGLENDKDFTYHSTRHTNITRLLENNVRAHVVKQWAGHTNISTTENYITTNVRHVEECADILLEHPASIRNTKEIEVAATATLIGKN